LSYVRQRVAGLTILQPDDAAELPDDGPVEWAPLVPYWSVLWRSGVALAHELAAEDLTGRRVIELGCGLALPSLVAARQGADVLATDRERAGLELAERNARENGLTLRTRYLEWDEGDPPAGFDLVLAADVLYERHSVALLTKLLPRLAPEVWLADPGRPAADAFLEAARREWSVAAGERDGIAISRLRRRDAVGGGA
jgi:predicted nicotinamide N-methyase